MKVPTASSSPGEVRRQSIVRDTSPYLPMICHILTSRCAIAASHFQAPCQCALSSSSLRLAARSYLCSVAFPAWRTTLLKKPLDCRAVLQDQYRVRLPRAVTRRPLFVVEFWTIGILPHIHPATEVGDDLYSKLQSFFIILLVEYGCQSCRPPFHPATHGQVHKPLEIVLHDGDADVGGCLHVGRCLLARWCIWGNPSAQAVCPPDYSSTERLGLWGIAAECVLESAEGRH